ncbi:MAG: aminoacyl-tRNA hydrolase [Candidatus Niyogibacteria bacterium CG10_big_fil_rev_8_21_14_0_10_46_36]|uniref:Aminoacyl-tRNA hydrolase n=1 Tax=Candidatus Niyogibacteria bacterium CG10_big_fil_rev_8_21_14_0_10_46_36 TaxID=1974726 RepID=A0A2H0TDB2_9BACT|nr:MAG: aminoacyl-tRNA hydrolase [Candidatus Niyogibacteria bacterium CG10_big_fil_rev_8_21_14_0_10_46_36]
MYTLVGLGNPGEQYECTRHNAGRMAVIAFAKKMELEDWKIDKKRQSLKTEGALKKEKFTCLLPETFMNKSGIAVKGMSVKMARTLVVLYDDIDIELGRFKISFDRGSGGHKGLESIMRMIKTKDFVRVRIGIAPRRKPGQKQMPAFLLKKFNAKELGKLKTVFKKTNEALTTIITEGHQKAMNTHN